MSLMMTLRSQVCRNPGLVVAAGMNKHSLELGTLMAVSLMTKVSNCWNMNDWDVNAKFPGAELQRGKRSRRLSAAEGEGDKKKYEKRPGVVRLEGPTENLQVLDPDSKHWRESPLITEYVQRSATDCKSVGDAVYHHTIRRILFQNAGPTSQYRKDVLTF